EELPAPHGLPTRVAAARLIAARMRGYVPHRQRFEDIAASMSASVGSRLFARSAVALINWPDWQYPHWGTFSAIHACWSALSTPFSARPSTVVILLPTTLPTATTHERRASAS